jgi:transposase
MACSFWINGRHFDAISWRSCANRLSAWTGEAHGADESVGKQRSGKTLRGKRTLRTGLTPLAHAAALTKGTYPAALYQRLAASRGRKRPIMAVAHAFVVIAFHMLSRHEPYCELGPSYLDKQRRDHFVDRLTRRMQRLGYRVHLEPVQTAERFIFNGVSEVTKTAYSLRPWGVKPAR